MVPDTDLEVGCLSGEGARAVPQPPATAGYAMLGWWFLRVQLFFTVKYTLELRFSTKRRMQNILVITFFKNGSHFEIIVDIVD